MFMGSALNYWSMNGFEFIWGVQWDPTPLIYKPMTHTAYHIKKYHAVAREHIKRYCHVNFGVPWTSSWGSGASQVWSCLQLSSIGGWSKFEIGSCTLVKGPTACQKWKWPYNDCYLSAERSQVTKYVALIRGSTILSTYSLLPGLVQYVPKTQTCHVSTVSDHILSTCTYH